MARKNMTFMRGREKEKVRVTLREKKVPFPDLGPYHRGGGGGGLGLVIQTLS